jgi:uncharacterized protein (DUF608 family)
MAKACSCSGRKCEGLDTSGLSRREFVERLAGSAAGLALAGELGWAQAEHADRHRLSLPKPSPRDYPLTPARVYRGQNLQAVAMPIGGIGTGSIWLDGQGQLAVWQIFNNLDEQGLADSFFAVRAGSGPGPAAVRVLQTAGQCGLPPVAGLEYEGGYPIARLRFADPGLPVAVTLEAFNPLVPLDAASSTIPAAIFRLTADNPGPAPAEVTFFAALQNAVGRRAVGRIPGVRSEGYGGNRNRLVRQSPGVALEMDQPPRHAVGGPVKVRNAHGHEVPGPEMTWLTGAADLTPEVAEPLSRVAQQGGAVLVEGLSPAFFRTLAAFRARGAGPGLVTVFEDFEKDDYTGWTITGDAFGTGPSHGTEAGQQPVSGFAGRRLVNTFIAGDGPQGMATSKPFRIERRYIGFLLGGGNHPGQTCVNLRVGGKVVRTATGKDRELLEPVHWDVADLAGQVAAIEIVDRHSGGWGHVNVDQILFSDVPPEPFLRQGTPTAAAVAALGLPFSGAEEAALPVGPVVFPSPHAPAHLAGALAHWSPARYTRLAGFRDGQDGYHALAATAVGDPLIVEGPLGKGRIILALAAGLPWRGGAELLAAARGEPLLLGQRLTPGWPQWGTMALATPQAQAIGLSGWSTPGQLAAFVADPAGQARARGTEAVSGPGETVNGFLAVPLSVPPGERRTATFVIAWHFPNAQRFQHSGNLYSRRWPDALSVARYVVDRCEPLWQRTRQYHRTVYESNLPEEFLDAMTSQSVIFRGPTCFWSEDGYFGGFEGSYGCCPLNCTHVWNYAQSHARLFPEVGRNMRVSNFLTFLHADGETSHREHAPHGAFIDGHCACIEAALREHQLSPDRRFLEKIWPGVKKAVDWLIRTIDSDHDGVPSGMQWNTYDTAVTGANTFIGSQYLSALAAGGRMALAMDDPATAERWDAIRRAGAKNQDQRLWNGRWYFQVPGTPPANDYDRGCHADQLLGQWWAHMLHLGYLYPPQRVKAALRSVMHHNFRENMAGFHQAPRRYLMDDEPGLLICTWPGKDRPQPFIEYADEVWTGIEYATAGAMIFEGLVDEARRIVRAARSRYDGRRRAEVNSGPGGNPFNELECGKFYARAMSSWSLLVACQGLVLDGPAGILGFKPKWQPEDHRSFYTAPEGWGLFVQDRRPGGQHERIEVRYGRLNVAELVFELPTPAAATATVTAGGRTIPATLHQDGLEARLVLAGRTTVAEGDSIEVALQW